MLLSSCRLQHIIILLVPTFLVPTLSRPERTVNTKHNARVLAKSLSSLTLSHNIVATLTVTLCGWLCSGLTIWLLVVPTNKWFFRWRSFTPICIGESLMLLIMLSEVDRFRSPNWIPDSRLVNLWFSDGWNWPHYRLFMVSYLAFPSAELHLAIALYMYLALLPRLAALPRLIFPLKFIQIVASKQINRVSKSSSSKTLYDCVVLFYVAKKDFVWLFALIFSFKTHQSFTFFSHSL